MGLRTCELSNIFFLGGPDIRRKRPKVKKEKKLAPAQTCPSQKITRGSNTHKRGGKKITIKNTPRMCVSGHHRTKINKRVKYTQTKA